MMITVIKNVADVALFTKEIIDEGVNMHPDEDFNSYVNIETDEKTYTIEQAELRNRLMNQCFQICANNKIDIYEFTQEIYLKETGLGKFIAASS